EADRVARDLSENLPRPPLAAAPARTEPLPATANTPASPARSCPPTATAWALHGVRARPRWPSVHVPLPFYGGERTGRGDRRPMSCFRPVSANGRRAVGRRSMSRFGSTVASGRGGVTVAPYLRSGERARRGARLRARRNGEGRCQRWGTILTRTVSPGRSWAAIGRSASATTAITG